MQLLLLLLHMSMSVSCRGRCHTNHVRMIKIEMRMCKRADLAPKTEKQNGISITKGEKKHCVIHLYCF